MSNNSAMKPSQLELEVPESQTNSRSGPNKRKIRRYKSAPQADYFVPETNEAASIPRSPSVVAKLHPSFRIVAILLAIYLGVGTVCFYFVRNQFAGKKTNGVLDALYICIVTMTTVGYGDLVPDSVLTKLLVSAFVFTGMALIGMFLSKAADYLVDKQEIMLARAFNIREEVGQNVIVKESENNRVRYKCIMIFIFLLVLIASGTAFLATIEKMEIVEAFFSVCSIITTLGYGFPSFSTKGGRIFAVFWVLTSTVCLAQCIFYMAELTTEKRQRALVKWVLDRRMTNVDIEAADLDNNGEVDASEFIIYKLKEMGKITQEDIVPIMKEFEELDVDQTGTLSVSDITLAQSSKEQQ